MKTVMLFIDGLGLAPGGPANPLASAPTPNLRRLLSGTPLTMEAVGHHGEKAALFAIDATLGVPGLPQSATGQTTLFTGVNAAKVLGSHVRGFPTEPLRQILRQEGMTKKIIEKGYTATFLNSYRPLFFELTPDDVQYFSASTLLNMYAGLPFRTFADMAAGRAVYNDITNRFLVDNGYDVEPRTPEEAGRILATVAADYDFLLFEHFKSDTVGHKADVAAATEVIEFLDCFIGSIIDNLDLENTLLIVTSDHGNLEDSTTGSHTLNPVPLLLAGAGCHKLPPVSDLTGVAPLVFAALHM